MWSAPPTRGWSLFLAQGFPPTYVCPAYAGMVPSRFHQASYHLSLPRLRGDGPSGRPVMTETLTSAPPTRGWSRHALHVPLPPVVCPAYAGMVLVPSPVSATSVCLPRLRGDGPFAKAFATPRFRSAPPTRGWSRQAIAIKRLLPVCPAYAGMVRQTMAIFGGLWGLPRLRGDGPES